MRYRWVPPIHLIDFRVRRICSYLLNLSGKFPACCVFYCVCSRHLPFNWKQKLLLQTTFALCRVKLALYLNAILFLSRQITGYNLLQHVLSGCRILEHSVEVRYIIINSTMTCINKKLLQKSSCVIGFNISSKYSSFTVLMFYVVLDHTNTIALQKYLIAW